MSELQIIPLTSDRWADLETLFGKQGAVGGCWCMWWRLDGRTFSANAGEANKTAFKTIVDQGQQPGLLGYLDDVAVGWISLAPRSEYNARFNSRSPVFKPLDDLPVWSILCFYVKPEFRNQAIARQMLSLTVDYARAQGIEWLEAVPLEISSSKKPNALYVGTVSMFEDAGFVRAGYRRQDRPFMRLNLKSSNV